MQGYVETEPLAPVAYHWTHGLHVFTCVYRSCGSDRERTTNSMVNMGKWPYLCGFTLALWSELVLSMATYRAAVYEHEISILDKPHSTTASNRIEALRTMEGNLRTLANQCAQAKAQV